MELKDMGIDNLAQRHLEELALYLTRRRE